jgi:hypothetical protein
MEREDDERLAKEKKQETARYLEQKKSDAAAVMESVANLAAVGHPADRKQYVAILFGSMENANVTKYLQESGYSEERQKQVALRKKKQNQARNRRAAKQNVVPTLVAEESKSKFTAPFSNCKSASTANWHYKEYLLKGLKIPRTLRPTCIKTCKIDWMIRWFVQHGGQY